MCGPAALETVTGLEGWTCQIHEGQTALDQRRGEVLGAICASFKLISTIIVR